MVKKLSSSILGVKESEIRKFNDYAKAAGCTTYLTLGEPDFNTPEAIKDETIKALKANKTKYGPTPGTLALREAICRFETDFSHVDYTPDEILITHGSTEALSSAFFTILDPLDEVIIPTPAYPMYRQIAEFKGGIVKTLDTAPYGFQIDKDALEAQITDKTKCIILTSPNNPTGSVYSQESLRNVYEAVKDKGIYVICDDVYNQIVYGKREPGFIQFQDIKDQIIICQSYSKSYAMPGWRCGYMMASREFISQAKKIHQYMISCMNTFIQDGMITALGCDSADMVKSYQERRDYVYKRLCDMNLEVLLPKGAFYIFPSIREFNMSSFDFCKGLADKYKVALIPGHCFEADDYIRLSYCVSMDTIHRACDALEAYVGELRKR